MPARRSTPGGRFDFALVVGLFFAIAVAAASEAATPFTIEILSSAPDQVSGGDALVRVDFPDVDVRPG